MADPDRDLERLSGSRLGRYVTVTKNVRRPQGREKECRWFELCLREDTAGESPCSRPVVSGLYSSGRESINLRSYMDVDYLPRVEIGARFVDLVREGLDVPMFRLLSELIQPGGKIIVSVVSSKDPDLHSETFRQLDLGYPPEATYIGYLLFRCGCGAGYKNWLIREGGREGAPALQGEKAASAESERRSRKESLTRLEKFLEKTAPEVGSDDACRRISEIVEMIRRESEADP